MLLTLDDDDDDDDGHSAFKRVVCALTVDLSFIVQLDPIRGDGGRGRWRGGGGEGGYAVERGRYGSTLV